MTGWDKDGSGLLVKRLRGRTLPQWASDGLVRIDRTNKRNLIAHQSGFTSNADSARRAWKFRRDYSRRAVKHRRVDLAETLAWIVSVTS